MMNWADICRGCGECCGPIPFEPEFAMDHIDSMQTRKYETVSFIRNTVVLATADLNCVFLTTDKRCAVYDERPDLCRKMGTVPGLPCPKKS